MKLVVGLGNPGPQYQSTRHNVGFMAVDAIADKLNVKLDKPFMRALLGQCLYRGEKIILAKPQTYMNLSGEAVLKLLQWYKMEPKDLTVIYDDLDLQPGKIRIRRHGGDGGHRGMISIINLTGTGDFTRVRIGIGRPPERWEDVAGWVLGRPSPEEEDAIKRALAVVPDIIKDIIENGTASAMNKYNGKVLV